MEYIGSSFQGRRNNFRHFEDSKGTYYYPTGSTFRGQFKDGQTDEKGLVRFEGGMEFNGHWSSGNYADGVVIFTDGLQWKKHDWIYCTPKDRRFHSEIVSGLKPAFESKLTDKDPPPKIPENCYDTGDGFYNPETRIVTSYKGRFLRYTSADEHAWIVAKCRKGWDEVTGKPERQRFGPK